MRRLAVMLLLVASASEAQIIRPSVRSVGPTAWLGLSAGLVQSAIVNDGTTNSRWDFGSATSIRASYEKVYQPGVTFGIAGGYASMPMLYTGGASTAASTACPGGCDARANVFQALALVHTGDRIGFHQVIELTGGVTAYSNFRTQEGGQALEPVKTDADMSFSLGYGFGFGMSPTSSFEIVQEFGLSVHQKTGLAANESNVPRYNTTRLTWRIGLGGR